MGADPGVEDFFWYAAQGGYGIQMAPALARTGAALATGAALPDDLAARGLTAAMLAPGRDSLHTGQ
ncbi:Probable FAD dependent oxidoreductase [Mycobacteroides abscessus subsp. abscessus]|nr:Probable FAD dependent oxidoreductase [Mycobacteroides abscessus subsp. abscessus]